MKRRRKTIELSLDSLLDILSNVVGVMILIAVLSVLGSQNIEISLGTPAVRDAPEGAERIYFECREKKLVRIDETELNEAVNEFIIKNNNPKTRQLVARLNASKVGNANYLVKARMRGSDMVQIFEPRPGQHAEPVGLITQKESEYMSLLDKLNPKKNYLYFIVRTDSFEIFRAARRIAKDRGLSSGWHPLPPDQSLEVSSSGLGGQVQ